jgi:hypothetical protein
MRDRIIATQVGLQVGQDAGILAGLGGRDASLPRPLGPIMAHPDFPAPMAVELLRHWPEWAIPGVTGFPDERVTLLQTNPQFVEALLVGLNHEMNRELLWRDYPTDQRGTPFRRFWPRPDGAADIDEIARWPLDAQLGSMERTGTLTQLVLLVRSELLRRYPRTLVLAGRATPDGKLVVADPDAPVDAHSWREPVFTVPVDERTALYAFDLTEDEVRGGPGHEPGWYFVFREPLTSTRFGLDEGTASPLDQWSNLAWGNVNRVGKCLNPSPDAVTAPSTTGGLAWGSDSAAIAAIFLQQPFQLAIDPTDLLGPRHA